MAKPPDDDATAPIANLARAITRGGLMCGVALLAGAVVDGALHEGGDWRAGLLWTAIFGVVGLALLLTTGALLNLVFLRGRLGRELARGNVAVALVAGGHFVAVGVILDGCFYGRDLHTLGISVSFYLIATATLLVLQYLYRLLTHFHDDEEVLGENAAAALGFVGVTLALAIIIAHAAEGTFVGWAASLRGYGLALLLAIALYPVRQVVVARLLLGLRTVARGGTLDRMVAQDRNILIGVVEAIAYVATALLATGVA